MKFVSFRYFINISDMFMGIPTSRAELERKIGKVVVKTLLGK